MVTITSASSASSVVRRWGRRSEVQLFGSRKGVDTRFFSTIDQMPARTARDYENIIARLNAIPVYIDQYLALMREQIDGDAAAHIGDARVGARSWRY